MEEPIMARATQSDSKKSAKRQKTSTAANKSISVWEDDPGSGVLATRPAPDLAKKPLAYKFSGRVSGPGVYQHGSAEFRYWTAAEALRRGADFWAGRVPSGAWEVGPMLKVLLDEGEDLNAYYDRQALNFFHGPSPSGIVYAGESPDILCHEMGHAILDSIKPQLWGAASHEVAALHESFGDMSAILSALQLQSLRIAILRDTNGHLYRNSRLSRLAEQLGAAIRAQAPDAVDPDCLRNAVNSFTYQDPIGLPQMAPASHLSSEPHSFSRLFTGAFFEALAAMLSAKAADPGAPTEQELAVAGSDIATILVTSIKQAPVVSNFYAQVAAGMVQASRTISPAYPAVLKGVFVRRSILSLQSATSTEALQNSVVRAAAAAARAKPEALASMALPGERYGLDQPLLVETPSHSRQFVATAAAADANSLDPASAVTAARAFVDDLFRRGRVDYAGIGRPEARLEHGRRLRSHRLVAEGNAVRLERSLFDCGLRHD
jgi:hypothetical protein